MGLGTASLATVNRIGNAYSSEVFSCWPQNCTLFGFEICRICVVRLQRREDARAHRKLVRADLAFANLITHHYIPVKQEEGGMELQAWPFILPESMDTASVIQSETCIVSICRLCSMAFMLHALVSLGEMLIADGPQEFVGPCNRGVLASFTSTFFHRST